MAKSSYGTVRAPEFPPGVAWLNADAPHRLSDFRGRFVLLDFWTYCCINCLHILPDLKRLERKYAKELVVIGVHSGKFDNERQTSNLRQAILRYQVKHLVVNDPDFTLWQHYAVRAWPTLFLIDPNGYIVMRHAGEGVFAPIDQALQALIPSFEQAGALHPAPPPGVADRFQAPPEMLAFPGKIAADGASERLFISDTNHHRILITDRMGRVQDQIGAGQPGRTDGPFAAATLRHPQGTCFDPAAGVLYIADTENHALRRADLHTRHLTTLAGDGRQATHGVRTAAGPQGALNSPWDVLLHNDRLFVAMAGAHQIWTFDPATGHGAVYAGNGLENIVDAPRLTAHLAQPSGLAGDGRALFFADSEASALRRVAFPTGADQPEAVETLVGEGLFSFGDADGPADRARLQHPLGVACGNGSVYVADTYNHKVKAYQPGTRLVTTLAGTGQPGLRDGPAAEALFNEPGGVAVMGGCLFVADTNNHRIRVLDLRTSRVETLSVAEPLPAPSSTEMPDVAAPQRVRPGAGALRLAFTLPAGYHPNPINPGTCTLRAADPQVVRMDPAASEVAVSEHAELFWPATFAAGATTLRCNGALYLCHTASGRCLLHRIALHLPVVVDPAAPPGPLHLSWPLAAVDEAPAASLPPPQTAVPGRL